MAAVAVGAAAGVGAVKVTVPRPAQLFMTADD